MVAAASPGLRLLLARAERRMAMDALPGALAAVLTNRRAQAPHLNLIDSAWIDMAAGRADRVMLTRPPRQGKSRRASRWAPCGACASSPNAASSSAPTPRPSPMSTAGGSATPSRRGATTSASSCAPAPRPPTASTSPDTRAVSPHPVSEAPSPGGVRRQPEAAVPGREPVAAWAASAEQRPHRWPEGMDAPTAPLRPPPSTDIT